MRKIAIALFVLTGAIGLVACGEKQEPSVKASAEKIDLDLDFYVNPDHAGIYTAIDRGFFNAAGLDVKPHVPSDPAAPIKQVAAGRADLAISYEPEVLLARGQGLDVKAVAAIVREPLTTLISLPSAGIEAPGDLRGKTVATAGIPYQEDYLNAILDKAGAPSDSVKVTNVGLNLLPALLGGSADAILGGFQNIEGVDLTERGVSPRIVGVEDLGVPRYDELVLVAQGERIEDDPDPIRLFIQVLQKASRAAAADPAAATQSVLAAGSGLDPKLTAAETAATLPLLAQATDPQNPQPYGYMDAKQWEAFAGFLVATGALESVPAIDEALTNELLPSLPD